HRRAAGAHPRVREAPGRGPHHRHRVERAQGARRRVRILLFTGKGGVGKTTVAASTALACADAGLRTLVLSTDPAHSLADAFDRPLTAVGTPITDALWGQQLDAQERLEDAGGHIQAYVSEVLGW